MLVSDFKNGQISSVNNAEKSLSDIDLSKQLPGNFPLDPPAVLSLVSDMLLSVSPAPILHLAMVSIPATSCAMDVLGLVPAWRNCSSLGLVPWSWVQ